MASWSVIINDNALNKLAKLERPEAMRIHDFLKDRIAPLSDPRKSGKALTG
jgi:mRNA-degrading endonuclease RelE of RelBE toxin-antitoxin system